MDSTAASYNRIATSLRFTLLSYYVYVPDNAIFSYKLLIPDLER
jgi:hypothetical protein